MLKYLMEPHGVRQADLAEIGSQGVVSEILSGETAIEPSADSCPRREVPRLAVRLSVTPDV
jgi:HTH-type transcriptional regulator/antitoxin HigA